MAFGKEVKKLLGKSHRREETSLSMASTENQPIVDNPDLDLVSDGILFSQDFESWFGRSIFQSAVAEVVAKGYIGHTAITLIDVLESVAADNGPATTGADKSPVGSQRPHVEFYRHIYEVRSGSSDTDWALFRQKLSSHVTDSCNRLRNEKVLELPEGPMPQTSGNSAVPTPVKRENHGVPPSSSSRFSSVSEHPGPVNSPVTQHEAPLQPETLQPLANNAAASGDAVMHKYTSILKEHADVCRGTVDYQKTSSGSYPESWHCTASFGDFSGEGIGFSFRQAKHAASKQLCEVLGLRVQ